MMHQVAKVESGSDVIDQRLSQFTELLSTCQAQLLATTYALVQNMADAEDICQRASLTLWRRFDEFELGTDFRAWAVTVARFEAMNFVRKRKKDRLFFSERVLEAIADTQMERLADCELQESQWSKLSDCIGKLSDRHQKLLKLYYGGTRTLARLAESLGCSEGSTRTALCRIRQSLRKCVKQSIREEPL